MHANRAGGRCDGADMAGANLRALLPSVAQVAAVFYFCMKPALIVSFTSSETTGA